MCAVHGNSVSTDTGGTIEGARKRKRERGREKEREWERETWWKTGGDTGENTDGKYRKVGKRRNAEGESGEMWIKIEGETVDQRNGRL